MIIQWQVRDSGSELVATIHAGMPARSGAMREAETGVVRSAATAAGLALADFHDQRPAGRQRARGGGTSCGWRRGRRRRRTGPRRLEIAHVGASVARSRSGTYGGLATMRSARRVESADGAAHRRTDARRRRPARRALLARDGERRRRRRRSRSRGPGRSSASVIARQPLPVPTSTTCGRAPHASSAGQRASASSTTSSVSGRGISTPG